MAPLRVVAGVGDVTNGVENVSPAEAVVGTVINEDVLAIVVVVAAKHVRKYGLLMHNNNRCCS